MTTFSRRRQRRAEAAAEAPGGNPSSPLDIPIRELDGPIEGLDGPIQELDGPIEGLDGPIQELDGPIEGLDGPIQELDGPIQELDGPIQELDGPIQELDGPIQGGGSSTSITEVSDLVDWSPAPSKVAPSGPSAAGAALVIGESGRIEEVSAACEQLFGTVRVNLVGADLYSLIEPDDRAVLSWALQRDEPGAVPPRRVLLAPPLIRILVAGRVTRLAEVWATAASTGEVAGTSLLLRERSVLYGINAALSWVLDGAPLAEGLLEMARYLGCEPPGHACYFITTDSENRRAERIPDDAGVPGPPTSGPWSLALWSALSSDHSTLGGLTPELQAAARSAGYAALRCYPVLSPGSGLVYACLVAWSREEGPLPESAGDAFRRALMAAGIALTMRPEAWEQTEADRVSQANRDPVTGLPNAQALVRSLDDMLNDRDQPAVLCLGIRGLDTVHENFGPLAVGTVERVVAQRLQSKIRRTDDVYRYEEGTLAVIYEGNVGPDRLRAVADRILAHVTTPVRIGTSSVAEIEASLGISAPSVSGTAGADLVSQALIALENAWRHGPNRVSFTVPTDAR